jgi:hypothetical protein
MDILKCITNNNQTDMYKRSINRFLAFVFVLFAIYSCTESQSLDNESVYTVVYKLKDRDSVNLEERRKLEQEFFDKVTSKNKFIAGHEFLINQNPDGRNDVVIMNSFKKWDDIEKSRILTEELIDKAWPDEAERKAFFEALNNGYDLSYSNDIYVSTKNEKKIDPDYIKDRKDPLFFYVVINKLADYDNTDSREAYEDYVNEVTFKNPHIKAYFARRHYIGSDSRDFIETYVAESYEEIMNSFDYDKELLAKLFPDEKSKDDFIEIYQRGVESASSFIYTNVPSMSKPLN